jgi:hypothetical protein
MTHMALLLNLDVSSLDLENTFCHEPCPRDLYVVLDGKKKQKTHKISFMAVRMDQ